MNLLFKTKFGSYLYGTATEKSDTDYKGIYLPKIEDCILQKISKSINNITKKDLTQKNTSDDIDHEIYSLQYFLQLAYKGETVALDMLHTPKGFEEISSAEWEFLRENRAKFYTKNLKAYVGYCKMQAAKYGIKGSRLSDSEKIINFLKTQDKAIKLKDIWDKLPRGENIEYLNIDNCSQDDNRAISVCSRKLMADTRVGYAIETIQKFYDSYGERAKLAKENKGIDWKAIHHAFRAGLQLKEIYSTNDLIFPLKEREFLLKIKNGVFHYQNDNIGQKLEDLIDEIYELADKSNYPEKVDKDFFDSWLISLYV